MMLKDLTGALFRPVQFASITARNRVVMAPMLTNFASLDDEVTDHQVSYYAERYGYHGRTTLGSCAMMIPE
jgi:2,4-dienoyl-CoA reductase-like NADH-dependent reductase (Old Yellow Enzyme family)